MAAGRQFAPASSIRGSETSAPCDAAPAQASAPAARARALAPPVASSSRPTSQRTSADRAREQRLEPLLGFLVTRGNDLCAHEQADHEHEEDEVEAEGACRREQRCASELREVVLHLAGQPRRERIRDHAHDEREQADARQPGDQRADLAAQGLRERRGQQREPRLGGVARLKEARSRHRAGGRLPSRSPGGRSRRTARATARRVAALRTPATPRPIRAASPSGASLSRSWCRRSRAARTRARPPSGRARARGAGWARADSRARPPRRRRGSATRRRARGTPAPSSGSRVRASPANMAHQRIAAPIAIAASAERKTRRRPTGPASTSSWRPVSSSVRRARMAASTPQIAANSDMKPPTRQLT